MMKNRQKTVSKMMTVTKIAAMRTSGKRRRRAERGKSEGFKQFKNLVIKYILFKFES